MADIGNSFTFWSNMKEAIDVYSNAEYKYKLYDALTEYGLYGIWPEEDGTTETEGIISFVQSMVPSIDRSRNYNKNAAEAGVVGGRKQKVTDEQIERAIQDAALKKNGVPTRPEVVIVLMENEGIKIDAKTISRRCPDEKKKEIALKALKGHKNKTEDKINVPQGQVMSQGQNMGTSYVSNVSGTLGQNGDKIDVSRDKTNVPNIFNF